MFKTKQKIKLVLLVMFCFSLFSVLVGKAWAASLATVSWVAPTTNEDETPLTDLAGFIVYYGEDSHSTVCPSSYDSPAPYDSFINVDDPEELSQLVTNLTESHQYYFTVVAYDDDHNLSGCATVDDTDPVETEVSRTISYRSDFDDDHSVGPLDFSLLHAHYGQSGNSGDADRDGSIGPLDFSILHAEYGDSFE